MHHERIPVKLRNLRTTSPIRRSFFPICSVSPESDLTVIELPDGTLREFYAPGVIMLSHRIWDPKFSDRTQSRLVASQWWGIEVLPATTGDVWITDGLGRYCEELYAEQAFGKEAGLRAIDEFAVGALMLITPRQSRNRLASFRTLRNIARLS